ncbi:hypothetical protein [Rhodohalobacter sp. 8-1]|uniref:hypothetical protein n=1 Tax=Rhodohalobacter sp. 8-1 TaxID=3131972 RepID=UPI0030ED5F22
MKTMTCRELGGACDKKFSAGSFNEIAELSKSHGMEMMQKGDQPHIDAMKKMQQKMKSPDAMTEWFEQKKEMFENLPEDK